jgi:ABC-type Fe3+ transport system permease subunit
MRFMAAALLLWMLLVPLFGVVWKLGFIRGQWRFEAAASFLAAEFSLLGRDLLATLAVSLGTGVLVAVCAVFACWLAREAPWFRWLLFSAASFAWVIPGPVVGIGLHEIIIWLPEGPWKDALYYGPSPLPLMWVQAIRAFPIAVVFLWPIVRMIPREVAEEARLAGARAVSVWLGVVIPLTWRATAVVALASAALCLGEVAASTRVETPGWESFTKLIFDRMHFGVDNNVSALCVLMLASPVAIGCVVFGLMMLLQLGRRER